MHRLSDKIIEEFGGLTELGKLVKAPPSTVNSWRSKISNSRLDHLRLAAKATGKTISWDTLLAVDETERDAA
jgi:hypothetical protein